MIQFPPYPETDIAEYRYRVRQVPFSNYVRRSEMDLLDDQVVSTHEGVTACQN
jgi:hypothetical protein